MNDQPPIPFTPRPAVALDQDIGKRFIRIDLDLIKKQTMVSGHIYDKHQAMNMLADAIRIIMSVQPPPANGNGAPPGGQG